MMITYYSIFLSLWFSLFSHYLFKDVMWHGFLNLSTMWCSELPYLWTDSCWSIWINSYIAICLWRFYFSVCMYVCMSVCVCECKICLPWIKWFWLLKYWKKKNTTKRSNNWVIKKNPFVILYSVCSPYGYPIHGTLLQLSRFFFF